LNEGNFQMATWIRSFLIVGFVGMAAAIAPMAHAETATSDQNSSETLNSIGNDRAETSDDTETFATQSEPDTVIAEVEGEPSEIGAETLRPASHRTPLTSRIFPCSSMEQ
jgi:hypothetical protein